MTDRNLVSLGVCDRHTKNPLTQENSLGVVAEGTVAKVGEERFRLIKPLVNGEIVLGLAPKLLGAALRVLEWMRRAAPRSLRSEEHTSELQSPDHLVCRLLLEKKKKHPPKCGRPAPLGRPPLYDTR